MRNDRPRPRRIRAERRFESLLQDGASRYERWRHLPRLVRVEFVELDDMSEACTRAILARLGRAIAQERRRAKAGHWAYDANRHIALVQARRGELTLLRAAVSPSRTRNRHNREVVPDPYELSRWGSRSATESRRREAFVTETNMS